MTITLRTIAGWTGGQLVGEDVDRAVRGFSTDTRTLRRGELFIALRGDELDGHDFLAQALGKGACGAVVDRPDVLHGWPGVQVADTLQALGDLAHHFRWEQRLIPWIAVTGSNGKTTTREMLRRILRTRGTVAVPPRNYNNLIGLPLTILGAPEDAWAGLVEMGTNAPGEIARLTEIATPTISIVTNIGSAHLAGLDSEENVAREKATVFSRLPEDGLAILPAGSPYAGQLREQVTGLCATFGVEEPADLVAEDVQFDAEGVSFRARGVAFRLGLLGRHNVANCLAALLAADHLGVGLEESAEALQRMKPIDGRLQVLRMEHFTVINDAYNANPDSLRSAVDVMEAFDPSVRRVVVIGDMLELGERSRALHREAGLFLASKGIDVILAVGREAVPLAEAAASASARSVVRHFGTLAALLRKDERYVQPGDLILVKGSRGMHMEDVIKTLKAWQPSEPY